jgi:hypothetical protein
VSVPADLARMSPQQLRELRAHADMDRLASPEVKVRLGEHIRREVAARAARN